MRKEILYYVSSYKITCMLRSMLLTVVLLFTLTAFGQTVHENTGWFAWFNSYKFSKRWGVHFDGQIRSADDWAFVRNILVRPGITYHFNSRNNLTIGYGFIKTYNKTIAGSKNSTNENRIWEQYIFNLKIGRVLLQNRFRLEQRFIERSTGDVFAQRLRYFARGIMPIKKQKESFNQGVFVALQNEIFMNIQNKNDVNNSFFDQNRIYGAIGYRINSKLDLEAGYMNQYINGVMSNVSNNIIQMALYTRL